MVLLRRTSKEYDIGNRCRRNIPQLNKKIKNIGAVRGEARPNLTRWLRVLRNEFAPRIGCSIDHVLGCTDGRLNSEFYGYGNSHCAIVFAKQMRLRLISMRRNVQASTGLNGVTMAFSEAGSLSANSCLCVPSGRQGPSISAIRWSNSHLSRSDDTYPFSRDFSSFQFYTTEDEKQICIQHCRDVFRASLATSTYK